jgi:hypothetical protein
MPSCDGYAGRYVQADGTVPGGFGSDLVAEGMEKMRLEDDVLGGTIELSVTPPARFSARPHRTVSQSEAGFEKIMQAVEITLAWPIAATTRDLRLTLLPTAASARISA